MANTVPDWDKITPAVSAYLKMRNDEGATDADVAREFEITATQLSNLKRGSRRRGGFESAVENFLKAILHGPIPYVGGAEQAQRSLESVGTPPRPKLVTGPDHEIEEFLRLAHRLIDGAGKNLPRIESKLRSDLIMQGSRHFVAWADVVTSAAKRRRA